MAITLDEIAEAMHKAAEAYNRSKEMFLKNGR